MSVRPQLGRFDLVRRLGLSRGRGTSPRSSSRAVWRFTAFLVFVAVGLTLVTELLYGPFRRPELWQVASLFVALVVGGSFMLKYKIRGETDAFDHFEAALVPAMFFLPPTYVVVMAATAKLVTQVRRRVAPQKTIFNMAQWSAAAAAGSLVFRTWEESPADDLIGVAVATVVVVAINVVAIQVVLALLQGKSALASPAGAAALLRSTGLTGVVNISFGVLFVMTVDGSQWYVTPLLLVPLITLHLASRGLAIGRAEGAHHRTTQVASSALAGGDDAEAALAHFLSAVGTGLEREGVDLVVRVGDEVIVRRWRRSTPDPRITTRPVAQTEPLALALLELPEPRSIDARRGGDPVALALLDVGHRDCVAASVQVSPGITSALALYDARTPLAVLAGELAVVSDLAREAGLASERARLVRAVDAERGRMWQIVSDIRDGILTLGPDGEVRTWNPALEAITGHRAAAIIGTAGLDVLEATDAHGRPIDYRRWRSWVDDAPTDVLVRTNQGDRRWLSCSYSRGTDDVDEDDEIQTLIVMARDVTELKEAEDRLAGQTAVLERIASGNDLRQSLDLLVHHVADTEAGASCAIVLASPLERDRLEPFALAGIAPSTLSAMGDLHLGSMGGWLSSAVTERHAVFVDDVEQSGARRSLVEAARRHGIRACSAVPIVAYGDRVIGAIGILSARVRPDSEQRDRAVLERAAYLAAVAVERNEFETKLAHQATHDALTELPNRSMFIERCERMLTGLADGRHAALVFVDLDRFKLVNDSMGHDAGDRLLVEVAERLVNVVRPGDVVARFGGDEYTVLSEGPVDSSHVGVLANRVLAAFASPFVIGGTDVVMSASLGVAVGEVGADADSLIRDADTAMYRAKELGGNRIEHFDDSMRAPALVHLVTHTALHHAIDNGELGIALQPVVSLQTGQVIGAEALLRWHHPARGVVMPDEFLSLAERTGLVVQIGQRVTRLAVEQAQRWRAAGPEGTPLVVNVNLSAREIGQDGLADNVAAVLGAVGVDPASICFEITESALVHDLDVATVTLRRLKEIGVRLAIDDFGTGYAPLTYLRRFPVDALKIDRSFVSGVATEASDRAIVGAVTSLARSLGLTTTAEGVESAEQLAALRDLGCDSAQGYLLALPGPASALEQMLEAGPVVQTA